MDNRDAKAVRSFLIEAAEGLAAAMGLLLDCEEGEVPPSHVLGACERTQESLWRAMERLKRVADEAA